MTAARTATILAAYRPTLIRDAGQEIADRILKDPQLFSWLRSVGLLLEPDEAVSELADHLAEAPSRTMSDAYRAVTAMASGHQEPRPSGIDLGGNAPAGTGHITHRDDRRSDQP